MDTLPEEIITNILSRIPVKYLLHCECVSKPWLALIKTPEFAHLHLKQQQSNSLAPNSIVVFSGTTTNTRFNLYSFDINSPNHSAIKLPLPNKFESQSSSITVVGSCNAILCFKVFGDFEVKQLVLMNPSVMSFFEVHNAPFPEKYPPPPAPACESWGFGYDSVNDDYKIVRIFDYVIYHENDGPFPRVFGVQIMIYSLKANTWKLILWLNFNGVLIGNNLLHWVQWVDNLPKHEIVNFDLCTEKWSEIKIPFLSNYLQWLGGKTVVDHADFVTLGTLDGCLCLLVRILGDVWVLKEYGTENQHWVKISDDSDKRLTRSLMNPPIAYNWEERHEILLTRGEHSRLRWYNVLR